MRNLHGTDNYLHYLTPGMKKVGQVHFSSNDVILIK